MEGTPSGRTASAMRARYGKHVCLEVLARQLPEPALEDLGGLGAGLDLGLQLDDGGPGELLEEGVGRRPGRSRAGS